MHLFVLSFKIKMTRSLETKMVLLKRPLGGRSSNNDKAKEVIKKFLIVGLGNIGKEYRHMRHNVGFSILDQFAETEVLTYETKKLGDLAVYRFKGRTFILLKPNTYMNRSGKAVKYWMTKEKVPLENVLIITDDLNIPFGTLRIKGRGSDGGHNGLKDIQAHLGTTQYARFRFGIGSEFGEGKQIDYVLSKWGEKEAEVLPERFAIACEAIRSFGLAGLNETMNRYNGK